MIFGLLEGQARFCPGALEGVCGKDDEGQNSVCREREVAKAGWMGEVEGEAGTAVRIEVAPDKVLFILTIINYDPTYAFPSACDRPAPNFPNGNCAFPMARTAQKILGPLFRAVPTVCVYQAAHRRRLRRIRECSVAGSGESVGVLRLEGALRRPGFHESGFFHGQSGCVGSSLVAVALLSVHLSRRCGLHRHYHRAIDNVGPSEGLCLLAPCDPALTLHPEPCIEILGTLGW